MTENVLVVEPDRDRAKTLRDLLLGADYEPVIFGSGQEIKAASSQTDWVAAVVGETNCGAGLADLLRTLRSLDSDLPLVTVGDAQAAADEGCVQLSLPIRYRELVTALARARRGRGQTSGFPCGASGAIRELDDLIQRVSRWDSTVLILGESGVGKELVARRIHDLSDRRNGPFVPVNCGAIPAELLESELFGHEKGAFTGALTRRLGRFEMAAGGTLFLDEIGDMSPAMQVKLLRVLQEGTFERIGSNCPRRADVRILAATHRDLEARIETGDFREDLFFRLNVFPVKVPALRQRIEDLDDLIEDLNRGHVKTGRPPCRLTPSALAALRRYAWPGNVRELANLLERLAILSAGEEVDLANLPQRYQNGLSLSADPRAVTLPEDGIDLRSHLNSIETSLIKSAMERSGGTVAQAARLLHLRRTTLIEKLRKLDGVTA